MKRPELYHKTVGILIDAYFNDTLEHSNSCACAVGNLIAANMNLRVNKHSLYWHDGYGMPVRQLWSLVHTVFSSGEQKFDESMYVGEVKIQIDSTGYSCRETALIEIAFEKAPKGNSDDEYMFNGLMAVIEVLDQIHENTDEAVTSASKKKFNKEPTAQECDATAAK